MKNILSVVFLLLFLFQNGASQEGVIYLKNPSFEGIPTEGAYLGKMIAGWYDCGFPGETIPDVHPKPNNAFGVVTNPAHGESYLGMVVRDNETWEKIGQELRTPMAGGESYLFQISMARSDTYESPSKTNSKLVNFTTACRLRIWGGSERCERTELLGESGLVSSSKWTQHHFLLKPSENYTHLVLEAFYRTPVRFPYNGNLLIDHASNLVPGDSSALQELLTTGVAGEAVDVVEMPETDLKKYEFSEPFMGTTFRIILYAENDSLAEMASRSAFSRIQELEMVFSDYREDSELGLLNGTAGKGQVVDVSASLWEVLVLAREVTKRSKGSFDFTAGALTKRWRKAFRQKEIPSEAEVRQAMETVGVKKVKWHNEQQVEIWQKGTRIDLGAIAKGYAVDKALATLKDAGVERALVDGGGDIAVGDPPPGKAGWEVKRTVYSEKGDLMTPPISLTNQAIATSGPTERFLEHEGKNYAHIIDPRTGYGVTGNGIVSVVAPTCTEADAWATAMSIEVVMDAYTKLKKKGYVFYFSE